MYKPVQKGTKDIGLTVRGGGGRAKGSYWVSGCGSLSWVPHLTTVAFRTCHFPAVLADLEEPYSPTAFQSRILRVFWGLKVRGGRVRGRAFLAFSELFFFPKVLMVRPWRRWLVWLPMPPSFRN